MSWQAYRVIFRLLAPMHIGYRKVGNIQLTRPYVTGRVLWGALTARLTRDMLSTPQGKDYIEKGRQVNEQLAFTYFYPALEQDGDYKPFLPSVDGDEEFYYRFLFTYASTALEYDRFAAEEGSLHEVEYIGSYTRDEDTPVYLLGYIFAKNSGPSGWKKTLKNVQLGGERSYGWGRVRLEKLENLQENIIAFGYEVDLKGDHPTITVPENCLLLAHTEAEGVSATGPIEPLVGREWENQPNPGGKVGAGQCLSTAKICYIPGVKLPNEMTFIIRPYGIWQRHKR